ncbi:MAG: hypothetical protein H6600_06565 [Flavobacteriales bacterium]|nr:hypothetical protein [Flavobacteriales bacterium]MCB9198103.1 hypothetical protein [Flavobacteriales bacterium]
MKAKKSIISIILLLITFQTFYGQIEKNTVLIDGYYGFPNLIGFTVKNKIKKVADIISLDIGGAGPYGGKIEYLFHDRMGIALDINSSSSFAVFDGIDTLNIQRHYEITRKVLRVMPRFNFHFIDSEKADGFVGLGIGYNNSTWQFITDDPNFSSRTFKNIVPITARLFIGGRYFFTNFLGINFELGLGGGGLLQGGLTIKI